MNTISKCLAVVVAVVFLETGPAKAGLGELVPVCEEASTPLMCRVLSSLDKEMDGYVMRLFGQEHLPPDFEIPMYLLPRLTAAYGDLAGAVVKVNEHYETFPLSHNSETAFGLEPLDALWWLSNLIAVDPMPVMADTSIPGASLLTTERVGDWAWIATARALAAKHDDERARAAFLAAADNAYANPHVDWTRGSTVRASGPYLLIPWAAAGFAEDALTWASAFDPVAQAWAKLYVAEGLALRGQTDAVVAIMAALPGDMPILAQAALAEAYRRTGDDESALALLDTTTRAVETMSGGVWNWRTYTRLAIGYALLGDIEMADYLMLKVVHDPRWDYRDWERVAPIIACHDLKYAIEVITEPSLSPKSEPGRDVMATIEVLIAGAASGHGADAYAFAKDEQDLVERLIYLMAVAIGLRQAADVPPDAVPYSTLNVIPH